MKRLLLFFLILLGLNYIIAQEILVPQIVKTIPNSKCYWAYSVKRVNTKRHSFHNYIITVNVAQVDSTGNYRGKLKLKDVIVYSRFNDEGITKKIRFKKSRKNWIAKFKIYTNQTVPLEIVAKYKQQEVIMSLNLNKGTYPGE
ncbi:hypothetical protein [Epilithonimonas sp. UC225_85]|uniref:hypothetical protein n=1 Tax=Epilithonimonas sp. UC225_85 TaxID=3350167 RepID=UPI0036D2C80F